MKNSFMSLTSSYKLIVINSLIGAVLASQLGASLSFAADRTKNLAVSVSFRPSLVTAVSGDELKAHLDEYCAIIEDYHGDDSGCDQSIYGKYSYPVTFYHSQAGCDVLNSYGVIPVDGLFQKPRTQLLKKLGSPIYKACANSVSGNMTSDQWMSLSDANAEAMEKVIEIGMMHVTLQESYKSKVEILCADAEWTGDAKTPWQESATPTTFFKECSLTYDRASTVWNGLELKPRCDRGMVLSLVKEEHKKITGEILDADQDIDLWYITSSNKYFNVGFLNTKNHNALAFKVQCDYESDLTANSIEKYQIIENTGWYFR